MSVRADDLDDRALVERFKRTGNPYWFAGLYERHRKHIYGLCCRLVENGALAEELMQETFMRAFKQINRFNEGNPDSRFSAWLNTICRNLCLSQQRKIKTELLPLHLPDNPGWGPEAMLLFRQIEAALDAMEEGPRRCWRLFHADGCTYEEIAHLTGYSYREVRNYLLVARRRLRKLVK